MSLPSAPGLETVFVDVTEDHLEIWEEALAQACTTVGMFLDDATGRWRVEGVKNCGEGEAALAASLAIARAVTGENPALGRASTPAEGWLARTREAFPAQRIGRFVVRGTHLPRRQHPGTIGLVLDAGIAFGSGEHASTRLCLRALEKIAWRRPRRILDLGTGSGILAMAAAMLLHRPVLASDIDPWSVRVAAQNAQTNGLKNRIRCRRANGWRGRAIQRGRPYDLVFANILARPLCAMAQALSAGLAPGGTAILAGLLDRQARMVLAAHHRAGLHLEAELRESGWSALILRKS